MRCNLSASLRRCDFELAFMFIWLLKLFQDDLNLIYEMKNQLLFIDFCNLLCEIFELKRLKVWKKFFNFWAVRKRLQRFFLDFRPPSFHIIVRFFHIKFFFVILGWTTPNVFLNSPFIRGKKMSWRWMNTQNFFYNFVERNLPNQYDTFWTNL